MYITQRGIQGGICPSVTWHLFCFAKKCYNVLWHFFKMRLTAVFQTLRNYSIMLIQLLLSVALHSQEYIYKNNMLCINIFIY